jgi:hypothetical protein
VAVPFFNSIKAPRRAVVLNTLSANLKNCHEIEIAVVKNTVPKNCVPRPKQQRLDPPYSRLEQDRLPHLSKYTSHPDCQCQPHHNFQVSPSPTKHSILLDYAEGSARRCFQHVPILLPEVPYDTHHEETLSLVGTCSLHKADKSTLQSARKLNCSI